MKQGARYFGLLCILVSFPLAFIWATWEGNAGTGASSDFPGSGLYARSDMFPRNTIVQIENLETGSTVRAVITGSSGVPGLVAVLSPDTASALNIRQGAVVRVRITVPSPVSERPAPGTLATGDQLTVTDPDVNPRSAVTSANPADPVIPLSVIAESADTAMVSVPEAAEMETFDEALASGESTMQEETIPGEMMDDAAVAAAAAEADATDTTNAADSAASPVEDLPATELPVEEVPDDQMATVQDETPAPELSEEDSVMYDEPQLVLPDEEAAGADTVTLEPAEPLPPESEDTAIPVVPPVSEPDMEFVEEEIPLVDTPPVFAAIAVPSEQTVLEDAPVVEMPISEGEAPRESEPKLAEEVKPSYTGDIPFIDRIEKGAYYVQIAVYRESVNVRTVLNRFGKKYPVVVEKGSSSGKTVMKVSIGPLQKDEYGAVLEYFQKNGFSDAFVRQE